MPSPARTKPPTARRAFLNAGAGWKRAVKAPINPMMMQPAPITMAMNVAVLSGLRKEYTARITAMTPSTSGTAKNPPLPFARKAAAARRRMPAISAIAAKR